MHHSDPPSRKDLLPGCEACVWLTDHIQVLAVSQSTSALTARSHSCQCVVVATTHRGDGSQDRAYFRTLPANDRARQSYRGLIISSQGRAPLQGNFHSGTPQSGCRDLSGQLNPASCLFFQCAFLSRNLRTPNSTSASASRRTQSPVDTDGICDNNVKLRKHWQEQGENANQNLSGTYYVP